MSTLHPLVTATRSNYQLCLVMIGLYQNAFPSGKQSGKKSVSTESEQAEKKYLGETSWLCLTVKLLFNGGYVLNLWLSKRICGSCKNFL